MKAVFQNVLAIGLLLALRVLYVAGLFVLVVAAVKVAFG